MTRLLPASSCTSISRQLGIAGRSRHQADVRGALEDLSPSCCATQPMHGEDFALARALEMLQPVEDFLLGFIADAAGVVEDVVGFFGRLHLGVAFGQQRPDDFLGIVRIHLAAEGFDVKSFFHGYSLL